jgi:serine/threonine-protein kinase
VTSVVEPGRRSLGDRYELQQLIAAGGMGQVWRGLDVALRRPVAVKVLRSEYTGDPTFLTRFRAEAQHAASLSHPNIAAVFDYGEELAQDGTGETLAYLVMELVPGEPLSALLARQGALETGTTLSLLRQTAFALAEAHRAGLVHRDVKPGNILVRPDGGVKITDFGIAWSARSVALTRTGQVIGTPQYLSPEQAEGRLATPASDVYALGLIGYECLTGHPAFEGDNVVTIAVKQVRQDPEPLPDGLPPGVRTLIGRAIAKDPRARIPDGAAFGEAIEDVLAGRQLPEAPATVTAQAGGASEQSPASGPAPRIPGAVVRPPVPRRRGRVAMAVLPLLGLLAGAGIAAAVIMAITGGGPDAVAAAEQRSNGSIVLDPQDYVGLPVGQVAAQLAGLGLNVELRVDRAADAEGGTVTAVRPTQGLTAGDTVEVFYAARVPDNGGNGRVASPLTGAAVGNDTVVTTEQPGADTPTPTPTPTRSGRSATLPAAPTPSGSTVASSSGPTHDTDTSTSTTATSTTTRDTTTRDTTTRDSTTTRTTASSSDD